MEEVSLSRTLVGRQVISSRREETGFPGKERREKAAGLGMSQRETGRERRRFLFK